MSLQTSEPRSTGAVRAMFMASTAIPMLLRGPTVTYAPPEDGSGALSLTEAASLLSETRTEPATGAEQGGDEPDGAEDGDDEDEDDQSGDDQPPAEGDAPDEEDPASEETDEEDDGDAPDDEPASEAPKFWSAEEKAIFAKAPPEVQQLVASKTAEAEQRVYAAKEEAAEARKSASVFVEARQQVDQLLERAEGLFKGKWDGMTPETWAQWAKDDPAEYTQAKAEFDLEQAELERLRTASAATENEEHRTFLRDEAAKLKEANHPLADPVKGAEEKKALITYAQEQGLTADDLKWAGARELTVLHKAMLYDRAQARLATKPAKPSPDKDKPKAAAVRPTAAPVQGSQQRRAVQDAQARFDKNPSRDNALALMKAKRG